MYLGKITNCVSALFLVTAGVLQAQPSDCSDPLPAHDYSQVGYKSGKAPIPYGKRKATFSFDSGRHTVDKLIRLSDGDVLRGAGMDKTILYFPKGLNGLGEPCGHAGVDCHDWANGVIKAEGKSIGIEDLTIIQTLDRAKNALQTVLWNVGERTTCPEDVYTTQVNKGRSSKN